MLRDATVKTLLETLDRWGLEPGRDYNYLRAEERMEIFGANIYFRSADNPDRLRGPNLSWAWLDEAAMMSDLTWRVILGRLRVGQTSAWVTTTPSGFNWVYTRFAGREASGNYDLIRASTRDNRFLPVDFVRDLQDAYTGEFARQEIDGEFVAFEGLVYCEFDSALNIWGAPEIPETWSKVRGIDYGYTNPFVCLWGAVDNDGRLYIYDEHYRRKTLIGDHADAIKARGGDYLWTVADHDAQDNAELQARGVYTINATKDVIAGIQRVKARLAKAGDGKPRLFISPTCVNTLKEIGQYRWADSGKNRNEKEEPLKENDHTMDVIRYLVNQLDGSVAPKVTFV
jgi:PBSX family phage terminase large subunit